MVYFWIVDCANTGVDMTGAAFAKGHRLRKNGRKGDTYDKTGFLEINRK